MMKVFFFAIALLIMFPLSILAADNSATSVRTDKIIEKKQREKTAKGVVKVVDATAKTIVIKGKDELLFTADEVLLREIRINDQVTVKYFEKDRVRTATSIKLDTKQKGKKKPDSR
jgi:hypothetical protein